MYKCIEHPRFGLVMGVFLAAGEELRAGQEAFINYGYKKLDFPHDFPWYWRMKAKADIELDEMKRVARRKKKKGLERN